MAIVLTLPPAAGANTYCTLAEAVAYFETRPTSAAWEASSNQEGLLVAATRMIDALLSPQRIQVKQKGQTPYYRITPHWTGTPTDSAQPLCWPRTGMYTRNGATIADDEIPADLKAATAELAGQLATSDRLSDNKAVVQGITSVKAGSVAVSFDADQVETTKVIPDSVMFLLVPSWLTDETIERAGAFAMEVY